MSNPFSAGLLSVVDSFIEAPTRDNREDLMVAADEYREHWILAQASGGFTKARSSRSHTPSTTYDRQLEVMRVVDDIPVKLALQERTSSTVDKPWWVLSWRTKYSPNSSNRRFYFTKDGCWTIPAAIALEMMKEMEALGGLDQKYFDHRGRTTIETLVSTTMTPDEKTDALEGLIGPNEDWGTDPLLVINSDPNDSWKKVMIVNSDTDTATFRSITTDPDYMPRKVLRPDAEWCLDNSMLDANVQQMQTFYSNLQNYLSSK